MFEKKVLVCDKNGDKVEERFTKFQKQQEEFKGLIKEYDERKSKFICKTVFEILDRVSCVAEKQELEKTVSELTKTIEKGKHYKIFTCVFRAWRC